MANFSQIQSQRQKQIQKLSQVQIQGINFLEMNSLDLRDEIFRIVGENPALKIVSDKFKKNNSEALQRAMENTEDYSETLQEHLLHQIKSMSLLPDEINLCEKLIYNLDENGFYGSTLAPEFLLDKSRPLQTPRLLKKCLDIIHQLDPVGVCCRTPEESLYVQAKVNGDASELTLFLLNGHLEFLNPPEPVKILEKLEKYRVAWHKKAFAPEIVLDKIELDEEEVQASLKYILHLNPRPAQGYLKDTTSTYEMPDVVVKITKEQGGISENNYSQGIVYGNEDFHFQVKYASGVLPEVSLNPKFSKSLTDKKSKEVEKYQQECIQKATEFLNNLQFRENSIILQACAIVNAQKNFFLTGEPSLNFLTRRQIAQELNIHESSVSRTSNKKNSKYFQTDYGLYPASYFFVSGVSSSSGSQKISSSEIKWKIKKLLQTAETSLSDAKIAEILQAQGIKISRRTVNKYRNSMNTN